MCPTSTIYMPLLDLLQLFANLHRRPHIYLLERLLVELRRLFIEDGMRVDFFRIERTSLSFVNGWLVYESCSQWHTKSTNSLPCFCLMDVSSIRDPIEVHRRSDAAILSAVLSTFPNSGGVEQSSCKARGDCCWPWKGKKNSTKEKNKKKWKNRMKQTK